jgi:predicted nucleic acid-binding protein
MIYLDTSALVPMFMREPKTDAVLAWLESAGEPVAVSDWSLVEFASAASMKVRSGSVTAKVARDAIDHARAFVQAHCAVATPGQEEFQRATELAGDPSAGLRAGDALHLAIAEGLNAGTLLCLDEAMAQGARALGMRVAGV